MSEPAALAVSDLAVRLEETVVLRRVAFTLAPGETVGLVGRNGAGKTTTLRALMGLVPSRGEVALFGRPIAHLAACERARLGVGYAPDDRRLIAPLSVAANLRLPAEACGLPARAIEERLGVVRDLLPELRELEPRPAGLLSGGQQKMVALGRALMIGEKLLLLDEPFQGLAPRLARRYGAALRDLRRGRPALAILVTESNPKLLRPVASRLLGIERGAMITAEALLLTS